ncbi:MAG TPA: hypothetical protein VMJ75_25365 [Candidatus Acidoferrales bacterium]|nr:hypothetical protein [Candidatus Acidoferrales bacterium]
MKAALVVVLGILAGVTAHAALVTYDFEDVPLGRVPTFTDTRSGVVANFSTLDPSGLDVYQNSGLFLLPPFMGHAVNNGTGFPIIIQFSASLGSAALDFGTDNLPGISPSVTLKAYEGGPGGALVASISTLGTVVAEFPQGTATISGPAFDTLVVSGTQPGLAIDNLTVSTVPEPSSTLLVFSAAVVLIARARGVFLARGR